MNALILVDIQNDFLPGGALPVADGDKVIPVANGVSDRFDLVVATRDWHPSDHGSFAANHPGKKPGDVIQLGGLDQILWPVHCVQNTPGAEFADGLDTTRVAREFPTGTSPDVDSYSGFYDNARRCSSGLGEYLKEQGASDVYILGLATDYCVRATALDAAALGFNTFLIEDGCRAVELQPGDAQRAVEEMQRAGVRAVHSSEVPVE
ncbi:MAG TPA: bifunctional nicotinamidase/pyrazinamidase [Phycisphaerae bacterium]|nr:bifunctional nicotinamidase/pyrazinamidase [Phycisphaerae bacterium]